MSNLHGEFLSIHKISQALPGVPKNAKGAKEPQRKTGNHLFFSDLFSWRFIGVPGVRRERFREEVVTHVALSRCI
jgi:hypothetical protein